MKNTFMGNMKFPCKTNSFSPIVQKPFLSDTHWYATDGVVAFKIPIKNVSSNILKGCKKEPNFVKSVERCFKVFNVPTKRYQFDNITDIKSINYNKNNETLVVFKTHNYLFYAKKLFYATQFAKSIDDCIINLPVENTKNIGITFNCPNDIFVIIAPARSNMLMEGKMPDNSLHVHISSVLDSIRPGNSIIRLSKKTLKKKIFDNIHNDTDFSKEFLLQPLYEHLERKGCVIK